MALAAAAMQDLSLEDTFDSYCIVCDRLIVPPKEKEDVAVKPKKKAAGAIRVSIYSAWPAFRDEPSLTYSPGQEPGWIHHDPHGQRDQDDTTWSEAKPGLVHASGHCCRQQSRCIQTCATCADQDDITQWR